MWSFFGSIGAVVILVGIFYFVKQNRLSKLEEKYSNWVVAQGKILPFSARFPLEAQYDSGDVPIPDATKILRRELFVSVSDSTTYLISASLYPSEIPGKEEENLSVSLDGILNAVPESQLVSSKYEVPFSGSNFLEYKIFSKETNTYYKGRLYLTKNALYQIQVYYTEGNYDDDAYTYFANSFSFE